MSELLKNNLDLEPEHVKHTCTDTLETAQIKQEPLKEKDSTLKGINIYFLFYFS